MRTLVLALAIAACGKADRTPRPTAAPFTLVILVGDQPVAAVTLAQLATWPRLDTLVPIEDRRLGRWDDLVFSATKPTTIHAPSSTYPDLVPAVFPDDAGTAAFGMFDPVELAKHGKPATRVDGVRQIKIAIAQDSGRGQHEQGAGGGADPSELKLSIKTPKGEHVIDGKTLLAIPRETAPGGEGQGWTLRTILKAADVTQFEQLVLNDAAGLALNLDASAFDPASSIPFVKLNRQGALRFRVYKKQGDGWTSSGDLRGLVAIEIVK
jgi:hypothetical protein